ncbi:hypothetical protein [Thalassobellus suaedae]|uniref:DUF4890 domain-containing protein n=1 Tax=Thalassobellus suaedae TaxID=3074124 RepID=A0ABY9XZ47_9FLAO|nr:hypothetical protein RHP49_09950 [Flavobacteriaceae bacterium HL-DH10]
MKKLIIIAIALISIQAIAQGDRKERPNREDNRNKMMNLSAEEMATLQTKKMTLHLDLNKSQQDDIYKINLENATLRKTQMAERKARKEAGTAQKPSKEERLKMMNARLDHKIAIKAKMKKILNGEQYAKWEKAQAKMAQNKKDGMRENKKQR